MVDKIKKILSNKRYLSLIIAGVALVIVAIVLVCVLSCGGSGNGAENKDMDEVKVQKPLFEFETVLNEDGDAISYPVNCISATDFYALMEAENRFAVGERFSEEFEEYGAVLHHITEINVTGTDVVSSRTGMYLEKGVNVYDINYTNCEFHEYDIDNDGENELVFYTCEIGTKARNQVCTYYVMGTEPQDIYWCRYNRAWAAGMSDDVDLSSSDLSETDLSQINAESDGLLVSLMLEGVGNEVYGQLACDTSGEEPFYYIEAGEYNELLKRVDGLDK